MTFAQQLVVLGLLTTAIDYGLTLKGLRRGMGEANALASRVIGWLGAEAGLALFALVQWSAFAVVVAIWPDQWALPMIGLLTAVVAVINNIVALRAHRGR